MAKRKDSDSQEPPSQSRVAEERRRSLDQGKVHPCDSRTTADVQGLLHGQSQGQGKSAVVS